MNRLLLFLFLTFVGFCYAQEPKKDEPKKSLIKSEEQRAKELAQKAPNDFYRIITIEKDTTYVDTSLNIKSEYKYNYLRKDNFGLLPFANEGQTYQTLQFGLTKFSAKPEFGFKSKNFAWQDKNEINYYSVATPLTELYFKTVMQQGQTLDALITLNTSERFNFSLSYKGIHSMGKYQNQLVSSGNFAFTSSYNTKNKRYYAKFHFAGQDLFNAENGGIIDLENFESQDAAYKDRLRLSVYLSDASSFQKGKRLFLNHSFQLSPKDAENKLNLLHELTLENKTFECVQPSVYSLYNEVYFSRFGEANKTSVNDQTKFVAGYNKFGLQYQNKMLGDFTFFADDYQYNQYYGKIIVLPTEVVPSRIKQNLNSIGAQYNISKTNWNGNILVSNSISSQPFSEITAKFNYSISDKNKITLQYQNLNKLPDNNFQLHQSSYTSYNWYNNFNNEQINSFQAEANTQWLNAGLQLINLKNHLYFADKSDNPLNQLIKPFQYSPSINYLSLKANKEFKFWKLALDNTVLFQQTTQSDKILNVPELVTRNTLYFSNYFYKKALYLQTGIIFNYFTKYYADDYNPVLAEFSTQNQTQIGGFPTFDFFINGRIRQTRIFIKAEHFNSRLTSASPYYSAPDYPYRDFIVRFGLVWNFFK